MVNDASRLDASVIVLNYNGHHLLNTCLGALMIQSGVSYEVIVVDNGSTDDSVATTRSRYPTIRVIELPTNIGVAAGYNVGFLACSTEFLVTLNNDTAVQPGWLRALVDAARSSSRIGSVASLLCMADHPDMIDSAGISLDILGCAWDRLGGHHKSAAGSAIHDVFGASAGAALYRREMLNDVGLFCGHFFAYLEDVDLAWRARLRGWSAVCVPQALVLHVNSATSGHRSSFKLWHLGRNRLWCIARNYPSPQWLCYLPLIISYDIAASAYHAVIGKTLDPLRGRSRGLRTLRSLRPERSDIQRRRTMTWRMFRQQVSGLGSQESLFMRCRRLLADR